MTTSPDSAAFRQGLMETGFWFVDIPRTSSSAIRYELGQRFGALHGKTRIAEEEFATPQTVPDHRSALQMQELLGNDLWDRLLTFSVVRNPWDRSLSFYHYRKARAFVRIPEDWTLKIYLEHVARARQGDVHPLLNYPPQYMTCSDFLTDEAGALMVDTIIRYETRHHDLALLGARIGVPELGQHLVNATKARQQPYSAYYDAATRALVGEIFAEDCERFGYRFDAD